MSSSGLIDKLQDLEKRHEIEIPWGVTVYDTRIQRYEIVNRSFGGYDIAEKMDISGDIHHLLDKIERDIKQTKTIFFYDTARTLNEDIRQEFEIRNPTYQFIELI